MSELSYSILQNATKKKPGKIEQNSRDNADIFSNKVKITFTGFWNHGQLIRGILFVSQRSNFRRITILQNRLFSPCSVNLTAFMSEKYI